MAEIFAVSIEKDIPWRGKAAPISNVYHLKAGTLETFDDNKAIDEIVAAERAIFGMNVNFIKARTWGPTGGGPATSKMREVRLLSGVGAGSSLSNFYPEFATMIYWPLGRYGIRNHPQYLRKWLHLGRNPGALPLDGSRASVVTMTELQPYIDKVTNVNPLGADGPYELVSPTNHLPTSPGKVYPFLEHRQIGR